MASIALGKIQKCAPRHRYPKKTHMRYMYLFVCTIVGSSKHTTTSIVITVKYILRKPDLSCIAPQIILDAPLAKEPIDPIKVRN